MEYRRFGTQIVQRPEGSTEDWQPVPADDMEDAKVAVRVAEHNRERNRSGGVKSSRVIRSERNQAIARELGLNADELAARLAKPDENQGTRTRVSEERFDALMGELGFSGEQARARFKGTYWQQG